MCDCRRESDDYIIRFLQDIEGNMYLEFAYFENNHYQLGFCVEIKYCPFCGYKDEG